SETATQAVEANNLEPQRPQRISKRGSVKFVGLASVAACSAVLAGCGGADNGGEQVATALESHYGIGVEHCELARDRAAVDEAAAFAFGRYYCVLKAPREGTGVTSTE